MTLIAYLAAIDQELIRDALVKFCVGVTFLGTGLLVVALIITAVAH